MTTVGTINYAVLFINGYSNGFGDIDSSYVGLTSDCWIPYFGFTWRESVEEDWLDEIDYENNRYDATMGSLSSVSVDTNWYDPTYYEYQNIKYDTANTKYITDYSSITYKNVIEPYTSNKSWKNMLTLGVLNTAPIAVGSWSKEIHCKLNQGPASCSDILLPTFFDHEYDTPFTFDIECSFKKGGACRDYFYVFSKKNTTSTEPYTQTSSWDFCPTN